ncbi:MAG: CpsD/CapB family tyrosine-protein kinase, partial [Betaproteobacteria bacterium]
PTVERAQVVAITSAESGEGKTTLATQLAISLAKSGGKTLLIDGDLRSPDVHRIFELAVRPGMVQVLSGECSLKDAAVKTFCDGLDVLPAGAGMTTPTKLLSNGALRTLLDEAREVYRYVIIDTPPVLAAAESLFLSQAADAVIVCVMRDVTRLHQHRKAKRRLADARANVVGSVFSGISLMQYKNVYGAYEYANWHETDTLSSDDSITA